MLEKNEGVTKQKKLVGNTNLVTFIPFFYAFRLRFCCLE